MCLEEGEECLLVFVFMLTFVRLLSVPFIPRFIIDPPNKTAIRSLST